MGIIKAGDTKEITLRRDEAYKIMTGAAIPKNSNAVIPKEEAQFNHTFKRCNLADLRA